MFALVDCNNFYASCERVFRPDLNGKPVVVLSNNDGCIIARSNEAKALGIPMGAAAFEYKHTIETHGVIVFSSNYALYGDMSSRVMTLLSEFTPNIEIYSIDEAFLDFHGFEHFDLKIYGEEIQRKITKWTGIPISVGIAPTKALSKVANKIAKKFPLQTKSVYIIDNEEKRIKALKWLKIEDVWGIGYQYSKRLKALNITNAFQFTELNDSWIKKHMSVVGLRLKRDLLGLETIDFEIVQPKKNISTTRSFEKMYTNFEELAERISTFSASCAAKLRKQNSCCNVLTVFVYTNPFRSDLPQYYKSIVIKLPFPSNSDIELTKFAKSGLEKIFKKGYQYKRAGVIVMDITPDSCIQMNLFENSNPKHKALMSVLDKVNNKYPEQKLKLASQDLKRTWKMKQEMLSPRYSTNINDIIVVNCYK